MYYLTIEVLRNKNLSALESEKIDSLIEKLRKNEVFLDLLKNGGGDFLEIEQNAKIGCILFSNIELPTQYFPDEIDDFIYIVETWFDLISSIRLAVIGAEWSVKVGDKEMYWNEEHGKYDVPF
ncbi:hypothetical protein [Marinicellulosiphila megalodicopiae]|uniref:hypothetical protein n=1 Tax=Marinicellulosiphila megalodicopiae TaxID=2724896 RepID=UPI003BAFF3A0